MSSLTFLLFENVEGDPESIRFVLYILMLLYIEDLAWYDILAVIWIFSYILEDFR